MELLRPETTLETSCHPWSQNAPKQQILQPAERFSDVTGLCHHSVFGAKSAENGQLRKVRFFVPDVESGARASKFARFPPKTGFTRFLPRKACEFQPAEPVAACHRFVTTRFLGAKVHKTRPSSRAPWLRFLVQKALKTVESEESVFCVGLQVGCPSLQIRRFSVESGLQTTTLLSFPLSEKRRIPARRACHRLSPLRRRSLWGRKVRQKKKACETSSAASMGLQILVDPASSHMLVSKPFLKRSRARFLPGPPLITLRVISTEVGNPTSLHTEVGFLAQASGLSCVGHRIAASILRWQQDCPSLRHTQDCPDLPQQPVHVWS